MYRIHYLVLILVYNFSFISTSDNTTENVVPESLANLTSGNDLWLGLVRDCDPPTFSCIQNNIYQYLRRTLDYPKDLQFTSFLKFAKNSIDYSKLTVSESVADETPDSDGTAEDDVTPLEEISRSLTENAVKFFTTHDMEVQLPENLFMGTTLKISPKSFEDNGALVKLEVVPKSLSDSVGEGRIFFKKIKKFISQRLIYALLAILLVIKLLAVKLLFVLPTVVGVAAAKKLLLKVLLFVFPALHHLFKLCAYVPYGAKHHIHKHQISHIHEISHDHHHPHHVPHHLAKDKEYVANKPPQKGPPKIYEYLPDAKEPVYEPYDGYVDNEHVKVPYFGKKNKFHRKDTEVVNNEIGVWSQGHSTRPTKQIEGRRPLPPSELEKALFISERETELKRQLKEQKQKLYQENLLLQQQLKNALLIQHELKKQAIELSKHTLLRKTNNNTSSHPNPVIIQSPQKAFAPVSHSPTVVLSALPTGNFNVQQLPQSSNQNYWVSAQEHKLGVQNNVEKAPELQQNIYKAATITYDPFYSPILEKIDAVLDVFGFKTEPCKERLICNIYKDPPKFSPHSNLLSVELSRETKELPKPSSTNAVIVRFYRYVQAARDGQDQRDCSRLYPACNEDAFA